MTDNNNNVIQVRCLLFRSPNESSEWCAVALEMDIWGFGKSKEEAKGDLEELIDTQVEFATGRKELGILNHPADKKWFDLWNELEKIGKESVISKSFAERSDSPIISKVKNNVECCFQEAAA